jgi:ATP-binding cassette subfamily B protein
MRSFAPLPDGPDNYDRENETPLVVGRADAWIVIRGLLPFVWPQGRPDLRVRVVLAFALLLIAKLVTVAVPIFYKNATDQLAAQIGVSSITSGQGLALGVGALILAYGTGRVVMMILTQIRDVIFAEVGQHAVRELNNRTFAHLHRLSLRFHLERRTGGLSRVIERATRAIELIIRMGILNVVPTILEMMLVCGILFYFFDWRFVLIVVVMVAVYMWYTFAASERRMIIRREMNESDTDANTKAIDSLLNFETVKYFGNEELEAKRFDSAMARYERAAIKTYHSLGLLNSGQSVIFTIAMTVCMLLAAQGVITGSHTIGEFVMINALMIQLYMPLNFMGTVYREIKQGLVDLETMFALLQVTPEIKDQPDAQPLAVSRGDIRFENVGFAYESDRQILKDCWAFRSRQINNQSHSLSLLRHSVGECDN